MGLGAPRSSAKSESVEDSVGRWIGAAWPFDEATDRLLFQGARPERAREAASKGRSSRSGGIDLSVRTGGRNTG